MGEKNTNNLESKKPDNKSFYFRARESIDYMIKNSLPGSGIEKLSQWLGPMIIARSLAAIAQTIYGSENNLERSSNMTIAWQEAEKGFANSPHHQRVELDNIEFAPSTHHKDLVGEIATHMGIKEKAIALLLGTKHKNAIDNPEDSKYLQIEPVITRLISTAVHKYGQEQVPQINVDTTKDGRRTMVWGKNRTLSKERAVRIVVPNAQGNKYYFTDLSYDQYIKLIHEYIPITEKVPDHKNSKKLIKVDKLLSPSLISKMLINGLDTKEIEQLSKKRNINFFSLDEWYDHESSIITISASDIEILDPRTALYVNISKEYNHEQKGFKPTAIDITASHTAATAEPIKEIIVKDVLALGKKREDSNLIQGKSVDKDIEIGNRHIVDPKLKYLAPQLARDQAEIVMMNFSQEGAKELARITNLNEIITRLEIPEGFTELVKQNKKLYLELCKMDETLKKEGVFNYTKYFELIAAGLDNRSVMLAVNPDKELKSPNALEMALQCNGIIPTVNEMWDTLQTAILKVAPRKTGNGEGFSFQNLAATDLLNSRSNKLLMELLANNVAFSQELEKANQGFGTPGLLARLAGFLRNKLEKSSQYLASTAMAQLLPLTQISSLGNSPKEFIGKVKRWLFDTSLSKSVKYGIAIAGNEMSVRHKAFEDTVATWKILDAYGDPTLLNGLLQTFKNDPNLDRYDGIAIDWLYGRLKQERKKSYNIVTQEVAEQAFQERIKSILFARAKGVIEVIKKELELTKYLQTITPNRQYHEFYRDLPDSAQIKLSKYFHDIAQLRGESVERVKKEFEERILSLHNGVHDLYTIKDKLWIEQQAELRHIKPEMIKTIQEIAKERSVDIQTSGVNYDKYRKFTNLDTFIESASQEAELLLAMQTVADRLSYALTEYVTANPNQTAQIDSLVKIANLQMAKKSTLYLSGAVGLATIVNANLTALVVEKVFEQQTKKLDYVEVNRNREPESEITLLRILVDHKIKSPKSRNLETIKQICDLAIENGVSPKSVVNYLFYETMQTTKIEPWLQSMLSKEIGIDQINTEISKSTKILSNTIPTDAH